MARLWRAGNATQAAPTQEHRERHSRPAVVDLADRRAADAALVGNKAAALAVASRSGFPVLPGFAISTAVDGPVARIGGLFERWDRLSDHGRRPVIVRSSSTGEDRESSSMAGRFTSVPHVETWPAFLEAVEEVLASADGSPMAVLVQPHVDATMGGVLFTVDPVTGRPGTVVEVVDGSPAALVDGTARSTRYRLGRSGRVEDRQADGPGVVLPRSVRRSLAQLAQALDRHTGRAQDAEWAFDAGGHLWLLQHRPVTATGDARPTGPVLGPGPVAETFPTPLRPLEVELWVTPLEQALRHALVLTGAASERTLRRRSPVHVVGGRVAADLELLGVAPGRAWLRRLDPRGPARRLVAAWRVGRLRTTLPLLAAETVAELDRQLEAVPSLPSLSDGELLGVLHRARRALVAAAGQEVLAGMLLPADGAPSAAEIALDALTGRAAAPDGRLISDHPELLVLSAPAIGVRTDLPPTPHRAGSGGSSLGDLPAREALRLRARWLQELTARAAEELGERLAGRGILAAAERVALLTLEELAAAADGTAALADADLDARTVPSPPLPARFRRSATGQVVPLELDRRGGGEGGRPAGGGRAEGPVAHVGAPVEPGAVLVVEHLTPDLAPALPDLAGLVAETGSALSHLAILARELGVATVVGVDDARRRFPPGARVLVDGVTGAVVATAPERGAGEPAS